MLHIYGADSNRMKAKFQIQDLLAIGMTFVVLGIALAYGLQITGDVQDDIGTDHCTSRADAFTSYNATDGQCWNGSYNYIPPTAAQFNATSDAITGVSKIPEKMPTIATVVVASVILGILVTYLWGRFK